MSRNPSNSFSADVDPAAVVKRLGDPNVYPDRPHEVRLVETHISQVFLTDRFVYKLKKPVRFEFLDFTTLERRERACRDELRLNRRLAPDVYLAVLPVTQASSGSLTVNGSGRVIDWVVQMRRLPAERMLDELIRTGRLTELDVRRLAEFLGKYYSASEPLVVKPVEYHASLVRHVTANFEALRTAPEVNGAQLRRVHTAQLRMLKSRSELFQARVLDGRIIDGHGDLRPEHVCLTDPPAVFDCLEFSADLRRVDVLDELCFLAMECDALQSSATGQCVLDAYARRSHDAPSPELTTFYKSYRACVRAKVAALRAEQLEADAREAQRRLRDRYLDLANHYLYIAGARPLLMLVTGLMGTGKSILAQALADELKVEVLRTDVVRNALFPADGKATNYGAGRYRPELRVRVYDELFRQAGERLSGGVSVILDGTFLQAATRHAALQCGYETGADVVTVECACPRQVALQRIAARLRRPDADASEARPELYDLQLSEREPYFDASEVISVDTTEALAFQVASVLQALPPPFSAAPQGTAVDSGA